MILGSFRTNQRALHKQGWAFIYSRCFQKKQKSIKMIAFKNYTELYLETYTLGDLIVEGAY